MHLIYPNIVRMVSIKFLKFINLLEIPYFLYLAPQILASLLSLLLHCILGDSGQLIETGGYLRVELFIRRFIKTGKLPVGAIKLDALVAEVFLDILLPLRLFEVIVPAPVISLNSTCKENSLLMLFEVNNCLSFQDIPLFCR